MSWIFHLEVEIEIALRVYSFVGLALCSGSTFGFKTSEGAGSCACEGYLSFPGSDDIASLAALTSLTSPGEMAGAGDPSARHSDARDTPRTRHDLPRLSHITHYLNYLAHSR